MIQIAEMWCGQNGSVPQSWSSPARFQELFRAALKSSRETLDRPGTPRCHSYVGEMVFNTTSNYSRGSRQRARTGDELAQATQKRSTQPVAREASSSRSINQLLAEPSSDGVQTGLHQAGRGSIAPPFRTAIMIG